MFNYSLKIPKKKYIFKFIELFHVKYAYSSTKWGTILRPYYCVFCVFLQRLIFLIRDWGCPHEFPYGGVGGTAYVCKQLQVGKVLKITRSKLMNSQNI